MTQMNSSVELLAPAGTFDSFIVAVQNGADAVYIGGSRFGARAFAGNFTDSEIIKAIEYAHLRDIKVYITVNTLINDDDFEDCLEFISFLYHNDADAVILQDIGLADLIHNIFPDLEIHASTQMTIANLEDAKYYSSLGFCRLVLARENTVDEINYIKDNTDLEIESFVHGALCVSYSGKCLFSYVNGGRSSNQGSCAQPCRKKYHQSDGKRNIPLNYFLSTKDLCTIKDLKKIIENGTTSLKIEGRMKRPEYVATVVRSYRKAINAIQKGTKIDLDELEFEMASIFNRQFTKGLILNTEAKDIVNLDSPNNIGLRLGIVNKIDKKNKKIDIHLERDLNKGDGLSLGEHVGRIFYEGKIVDHASKGQVITLDYIGNAQIGEIVQKTSDKKLIDQANESLRKELLKRNLNAKITILINQYPEIEIMDDRGNHIHYKETVEKVSLAQNKALSEEDILFQIKKTEDTPFQFESIDITLDQSVFLKKSTLNSLRRNALEQLSELRKKYYNRSKIQIPKIIKDSTMRSEPKQITPEMIRVKCTTKQQVKVCQELGVGSVYTDDLDLLDFSIQSGLKTFYRTPIVLKDSHIKKLDSVLEHHQPNILTTSLGYAKYITEVYQKKGIHREIRLDYFLNAYNQYTFKTVMKTLDIGSITLSLEHPMLSKLSSVDRLDPVAEVPIYMHPILMVTEYCPYKRNMPCKICQVNSLNLTSEDRKMSFTICKDLFCRMQLVDNKVMDFYSVLQNTKIMGVDKYRIDFLNESTEETRKIITKVLGK